MYSLTSSEFKALVRNSEHDYQMVVLHTVSCPSTRATMNELIKYFKDLKNYIEIYLVTPSDQIWKYRYTNYLNNLHIKRYMLNSEVYSLSMIDVHAQGHSAKDKFIRELCDTCNNHPGSFVVLVFDKKLNLLLYTDENYLMKLWTKDMSLKQSSEAEANTIYLDVLKIIKSKE